MENVNIDTLGLEREIITWWNAYCATLSGPVNPVQQQQYPPTQLHPPSFVQTAMNRVYDYNRQEAQRKIEPIATLFLHYNPEWCNIIKECDVLLSQFKKSNIPTAIDYLQDNRDTLDIQEIKMLERFQNFMDTYKI